MLPLTNIPESECFQISRNKKTNRTQRCNLWIWIKCIYCEEKMVKLFTYSLATLYVIFYRWLIINCQNKRLDMRQDLKRWFLYHSIVLMFYKHALLIHDTKCVCLMFYVILRFFTPFRWFWIIFLENQIPVHSRQIVLGLHAKLDWFFLLFIL